ncbi:MAG TPA: hypothetical protein VJN70_20840 [Gemmatimonadaceae bacterium]|nr:hypothetical protein [Gemmatimonadaceae bacterium]
MVNRRIVPEPHTDLRNSLVRLACAALSVAACSSIHRVPTTAPAPVTAPAVKTEPEPPPVFTSRDGAPTSFVASTSDAKTTRVVAVRDGLTKQAAFRTATEYLEQKKYPIYVSDPNAGYLMTPWQATLTRDGAPELRYRTRIILRFLGDDWKQLAIQAEANWLHGEEWTVGYDAPLLDSVSTDLAGRLGKRN